MRDMIISIVGESGAGKSTIVNKLKEQYDYNVIDSYTTRRPRYEGETGHIFSTIEDYNNHKQRGIIIAETYFDNNYYWSTKEQYQGMGVTLYVVDPHGVDVLRRTVEDAKILAIYLKTDKEVRLERMSSRGLDKAKERIEHDKEKFKLAQCDWVIDNNGGVEETVRLIKDILK